MVTRYVSISTFACLVDISVGIASLTAGFKVHVITSGTKKYKSIIKKTVKKRWRKVIIEKS